MLPSMARRKRKRTGAIDGVDSVDDGPAGTQSGPEHHAQIADPRDTTRNDNGSGHDPAATPCAASHSQPTDAPRRGAAAGTKGQSPGALPVMAPPVPGSRTWIEQQAAKPPQTKKQAAREKRNRKRKQKKQVRQEEGWVREVNAWGEKGRWIRPTDATTSVAATGAAADLHDS